MYAGDGRGPSQLTHHAWQLRSTRLGGSRLLGDVANKLNDSMISHYSHRVSH